MRIDINNLPNKLSEKDCCFTSEQDRIFTNLILKDYDWMYYRIQAKIPFEGQQLLFVEFAYLGTVDSTMLVKSGDDQVMYRFATEIFDKYFKKYLTLQKRCVLDEQVFYGGELALAFYNEVMKKHTERMTEF